MQYDWHYFARRQTPSGAAAACRQETLVQASTAAPLRPRSLRVPYRAAINAPAGVAQAVDALLEGACDEDAMTATVSADLYQRQHASSPKRRVART